MATKLTDFLSAHKQRGFTPIPRYFLNGDYLSFFLRDVRCVANRVDDVLTIYRSMDDPREFVGCEIHDVQKILETASSFGVELNAGKLTLGFFFLVGLSQAKEESQRRYYYELKDLVKDVSITVKMAPA